MCCDSVWVITSEDNSSYWNLDLNSFSSTLCDSSYIYNKREALLILKSLNYNYIIKSISDIVCPLEYEKDLFSLVNVFK